MSLTIAMCLIIVNVIGYKKRKNRYLVFSLIALIIILLLSILLKQQITCFTRNILNGSLLIFIYTIFCCPLINKKNEAV